MSKFVYLIRYGDYHVVGIWSDPCSCFKIELPWLVTGLDWYTPIDKLLQQCGWLSINQLVYFHSLALAYQVKTNSMPKYLSDNFSCEFSRQTRLATGGGIRRVEKSRTSLRQAAFQVRAAQLWNDLPIDIRRGRTAVSFKVKLKEWVKSSISTCP